MADRSEVRIPVGNIGLAGDLVQPENASGVVLFAHGSGSSRHSPRNRQVAEALNERGLATLLMDLLTAEEESIDIRTAELRFDIDLLTERLVGAVGWLTTDSPVTQLPIGLFGASTGAAGALRTAAQRPDAMRAVVSRGGRPDLAGDALGRVKAPTLLIVGGLDVQVIGLNENALEHLTCVRQLEIVPGATHLFEEPGALEQVSALAGDWFVRHLSA